MMDLARYTSTPLGIALVVLLGLALVLGGQGMRAAVADGAGVETGSDTTAAVGDAAFAYLTGLRTFAAATLWNRLEPIFHDYYEDRPLVEQTYIMPTIDLIVRLDPKFEQAYYLAPYILASHGDLEEGLVLARKGVEELPASGTIRASFAQILLVFAKDPQAAAEQADIGIATAQWVDDVEKHDAYQIFRVVYKNAGEFQKEAFMVAELERLDEVIGDELPPEAHDHDGDGEPDH